MRKILLLLAVALTVHVHATAQSTCPQTLRLAQSIYDQGRLHELPPLLEGCLKSGFSAAEKVSAYKLLTLTYIYLEEPEKADEMMLALLRTDHYFQVSEGTDPAEFIALYKTFRTHPIYRIGLKLGLNATQPSVTGYLPSNDGTSKYSYGLGFQGGVAFEFPVSRKFVLNPELNFALKNFDYNSTVIYTEIVSNEERNYSTLGKENQTWLSLPIALQYQIISNKFNPYIALGVSTDLLLGSTNKFSRTREQATSIDEQSIDITSTRNKINVSATASAGIKLKVTGGFFMTGVRYTHGLSTISQKENTYSLSDRTFSTVGYIDGIFKINSLQVTAGYLYNIFNPKKLKK
jgi:hypothetical protein